MDLKDVLCVGSPLLDITINISQEILKKYGLQSDNCIRETEKQETLFQSLFSDSSSHFSAGGSALNTARIAKWILEDKGNVYFAGCVGEDDYANTLQDCLQTEGVRTLFIPIAGETTGICACLLSSEKGERSMCTRLGAAKYFSEQHLREKNIPNVIRQAKCIFIVGYFLAHSADVVLAVANTCSDTQVFSISLSAEYICRDYAKILMRVLPQVDILFSNEAEIKVLAESLGWKDVSVEDIAQILANKERPSNRKPRIVVVSRGPDPVIVVQGTNPVQFFPVPTDVKVIDSVGCGDALAGAFLAVYILTGDVSRAVKTGIAAAVEIAQVLGCEPTNKKLYPAEEYS